MFVSLGRFQMTLHSREFRGIDLGRCVVHIGCPFFRLQWLFLVSLSCGNEALRRLVLDVDDMLITTCNEECVRAMILEACESSA